MASRVNPSLFHPTPSPAATEEAARSPVAGTFAAAFVRRATFAVEPSARVHPAQKVPRSLSMLPAPEPRERAPGRDPTVWRVRGSVLPLLVARTVGARGHPTNAQS